MYTLLIITVIVVLLVFTILSAPTFGRLPEGNRFDKIRQLPNYKDGQLINISFTPVKPDDVSYWKLMSTFFFGNHPNKRPDKKLPHISPDFGLSIHPKLTWFGHSSYLLQIEGVNLLVDPVFSAAPSPFAWLGSKRFDGTEFMNTELLPVIDLVLLTHDHYDHLDYSTILKLKKFNPHFIVSIGVGEHLEKWGIPTEQITEMAWGESYTTRTGFRFTATSARHFSGRKFKRNQSLWAGYVLEAGSYKLYLGGDSGYDTHFKEIGEQHGPFDLAVLECGQYNTMWPNIHLFPEETVQAAIDLKAKVLLPVHWGKFMLSMHPWNEPVERAVKHAAILQQKITTPLLGEAVIINERYPDTQWWKGY